MAVMDESAGYLHNITEAPQSNLLKSNSFNQYDIPPDIESDKIVRENGILNDCPTDISTSSDLSSKQNSNSAVLSNSEPLKTSSPSPLVEIETSNISQTTPHFVPKEESKVDNNFNANSLPDGNISHSELSSIDPISNSTEGIDHKNTDTTEDIDGSNQKRKVKFPQDNNIVLSYHEPYDHWQNADVCSSDELIDMYIKSSEIQQVRPIPILLEQLQGINLQLCNERYDMISLKGIKLDSRHVETLEEIFKRVQFKTLDFENTNLDDDMAISLFDMVEFYESCTKLNIAMNPRLTYRAFQACSRMMKKSQCLNILDVRGIVFADISMPALARSLRVGSMLTVMHMENCNISSRNLLILVSALKVNEYLRELYLNNNKMMTTDGIQLGALLKVNHRLQLLDVRNNSLGDVGVSHLCDGLYEQVFDTGLLSLSLWSNSLTHLGMPAMAQALKRCRHLQTLNLANNAITSEGAHYLREGLLCNRSLLRLSLYGCKISCEGAVALAEYIADTKQLLRLDLRENDVRTGGLMALTLALKVNTSVTRLDLDRDPKKDPGVKEYLISQRESLDQIEELLRRNRTIATDLAERLLEAEQNSLLGIDSSRESEEVPEQGESSVIDPEVRVDDEEEKDELPRRPNSLATLENDVGDDFNDFNEKYEAEGSDLVSPSADVCSHLAQLVVSPTDQMLDTDALHPTTASPPLLSLSTQPLDSSPDPSSESKSPVPRVVGMRSEMKKAGSGRTFLVTTTVYQPDADEKASSSDKNINNNEDVSASDSIDQQVDSLGIPDDDN